MAETIELSVLLQDVVERLRAVERGQIATVAAVREVEKNTSTDLATIKEQIRGLSKEQGKMVSRAEFSPVKTTVFGLLSAIGFAIVAGIANYFFN